MTDQPAPESKDSDNCLDNPQLTAAIGYPVRCPHCATTVPPTHWTKHLQRHHPDATARQAADSCPGFKVSGLCMLCGDGRRWHRGEQPTTGYCPHCGRGDAGPTADQYEQQRKRADQAEAAITRVRAYVDRLDQLADATISAADRRLYGGIATDLRARLTEPKERL